MQGHPYAWPAEDLLLTTITKGSCKTCGFFEDRLLPFVRVSLLGRRLPTMLTALSEGCINVKGTGHVSALVQPLLSLVPRLSHDNVLLNSKKACRMHGSMSLICSSAMYVMQRCGMQDDPFGAPFPLCESDFSGPDSRDSLVRWLAETQFDATMYCPDCKVASPPPPPNEALPQAPQAIEVGVRQRKRGLMPGDLQSFCPTSADNEEGPVHDLSSVSCIGASEGKLANWKAVVHL